MPTNAPAPYEVTARNLDPASDNRIHDDDVARAFGFTGALVPGEEVFAHATSPLVAAWGAGFFDGGRVALRFRRPVYDGETVVVTAPPLADGFGLAVTGADGVVRAVGTAHAPVPGPPVDLDRYPVTALPERLVPDPLPGPFGTVQVPVDAREALDYVAAVGDPVELYRTAGLVHPGRLLRLVNLALMSNVELGPWIHTSSDCRFLALPAVPTTASVRSVVTGTRTRGAHDEVTYDAVVLFDDRPVLEVVHTALYRLGT